MKSISFTKCMWIGLAVLALAAGHPLRAQSDYSIASRNELATLLLNAEETRLAERRQANASLAEQRRRIANRDTQIADLRSELASARRGQRELQERLRRAIASSVEDKLAYTEALAERDADYARELRILRESGERLLETADGREALRLYNTGDSSDWERAKLVLEQIDRTREEVASRERTDRRRSIAVLYREKRARGQESTAATLAMWERVVEGGAATASDWTSLAELQRDYFQFDAARVAIQNAVELADGPLDRARSEIELATLLLEREELEAAGPVVASAIDNAREARELAPASRDTLLTLLRAINLADQTKPSNWGELVVESSRLVDAAAPADQVLVAWRYKVQFSAKLQEIHRTDNEWRVLDRSPSHSRHDPIVVEAMERADRTERSVIAFCQSLEQVAGVDTASWLWIELLADCYLRSAFEQDIYDDMVIGVDFFPERLERSVALLGSATARDPSNRRALYKLGRNISRVYADTADSGHLPAPNPALFRQGLELLESLAQQTGDPMVKAELADALQEAMLRSLVQGEHKNYLAQMSRVMDLRREVILAQPDNPAPLEAALRSFLAIGTSFEHWGVSEDVFLARSGDLLDFVETRIAALGEIPAAERFELLEPLLQIHRLRCFKEDVGRGSLFYYHSFRFTHREQLLPCLERYAPAARAAYTLVETLGLEPGSASRSLVMDMATVMWIEVQLSRPNSSERILKLLQLMDFVTRTREDWPVQPRLLGNASNELLSVIGNDEPELRELLDAHWRSLAGNSGWPRLEDRRRTMERIRALAIEEARPDEAIEASESPQSAEPVS